MNQNNSELSDIQEYQVFARKYRPQIFDEMIGQPAVVQSLKNGLQTGHIPHAFLFSGPRGVGKTSAARILAKSLNCMTGTTPLPCNQCENCLEITSGHNLDVYEIDGASNTGVDNIRDLKEKAYNKPVKSRYKIYIIDEVHMLSNSAFNALLKILEEPPQHLVFVFATTEMHKIPETIISRCQVFRFKRLGVDGIIQNLDQICRSEGIEVAEDARQQIFTLIAEASQGGMRDALVTLDQLALFLNRNLTLDDVQRFLWENGAEDISALVLAILNKDLPQAIEFVHRVYEKGNNLENILSRLLDTIRVFSLLKSGVSPDLAGDSDGTFPPDLISQVPLAHLMYLSDLIMKAQEQLKIFPHSLFVVEGLLIKAVLFSQLTVDGNSSNAQISFPTVKAPAASSMAKTAAAPKPKVNIPATKPAMVPVANKKEVVKEAVKPPVETAKPGSLKDSLLNMVNRKKQEKKTPEVKPEIVDISSQSEKQIWDFICTMTKEELSMFKHLPSIAQLVSVEGNALTIGICPNHKDVLALLKTNERFLQLIQLHYGHKVTLEFTVLAETVDHYAMLPVQVKNSIPEKYWEKVKLLQKKLQYDRMDVRLRK